MNMQWHWHLGAQSSINFRMYSLAFPHHSQARDARPAPDPPVLLLSSHPLLPQTPGNQ